MRSHLLLEEGRHIKSLVALGDQALVGDDGLNQGCGCHIKTGVPSLQTVTEADQHEQELFCAQQAVLDAKSYRRSKRLKPLVTTSELCNTPSTYRALQSCTASAYNQHHVVSENGCMYIASASFKLADVTSQLKLRAL